jgi:hypothetical protein
MVLTENVIKGEICGLAMVVWVFVAVRNWLICDLELRYASGSDCIREVQSVNFQDENLRFDLNWLRLAMALLKSEDFLWGENLRSMI